MGNTYNVIEAGVIQCACGGKVTLTSTAKVERIAGAKPLYLKDIIGAKVACPRSKNKCTKVASISTAGTETNVKSTANHFLLRTDGFKTDKGRAVVLKAPGQTTSKIIAPPSIENEDVIANEKIIEEEYVKQEDKTIENYELYLIRKSQDIYKPIRPSRGFRKADETYVSNKEESEFDNIYSHTLAFVYVVKGSEYLEYKIYNNGGINAEELKDIQYQDTKTEIIRKFIPLEEETSYQIYYSNFKLNSLSDIQKLPELKIDTKSLDSKSGIYIKDIDSINKNEIEQKLIDAQKSKNEEKNLNIIVGFIEDPIGEIEDLYEEYYTNYKLAYSYNQKIFDDIKKRNSYAYTIANLVDYFYVSDFEEEKYRKNLFTLRDCYKEFIEMIFHNKELYNYVLKFKDIENIVHKDVKKKAFSYIKVLTNYSKGFFDHSFIYFEDENKSKIKKHYFKKNIYFNNEFIMLDNIKLFYSTNVKKESLMRFTGNDDYTLVKEDAEQVLAHIVFCLFFLDDFKDDIKPLIDYQKFIKIRNDFLIAYRRIIPLPNIGYGKISNVKSVVENQEFYNETVFKNSQTTRDKKNFIKKIFSNNEKNNHFLEDYKQLDNHHIMKSFDYSYKISYKSNLLYIPKDIKYYQEKAVTSPKTILKTIKTKFLEGKLKKLLLKYQSCNIDSFEYVVGGMNIIYSLCSCKIPLDEEVSVNGIFASEDIKYLLNFTDDIVDKKIKLEDTKKEFILGKYQISEHFDEYLIKQLLNELLFLKSSNISKEKAQKFFDKYHKLAKNKKKKKDEKTGKKDKNNEDENEKIEPLDLDKDIKKSEKEIHFVLKFICGITNEVDNILKGIKRLEIKGKIIISESRALQLGLAFKSYASMLAIASIKEYIYDNKNKDIKSTIGFVNDFAGLNSALIGILQNEKFENIAQTFLNKMNKKSAGKNLIKINLANNDFLTASGKFFAKVSAYSVIIIAILDAKKYEKNEDYDALAATVGMITLNIVALLVTSGTPLVVFVSLSSIAYAILMLKFVDSAFESYLKKSLFYNDRIYLKNNRRNQKIYTEGFPAKYLLETTNRKEELKTINSEGFRSAKNITNFIGENYKINESYFDIALKNELSFLQSAMYGFKLDKEEIKSHQKVKTVNGYDIDFYAYEGLKIPKIIAEDKDFKLFFSPYKDEYLEFKLKDLIKESIDYLFNFFPEENSYFSLNNFANKIKKENHSSYIIVTSSLIDLKYKVVFKDLNKIATSNLVPKMDCEIKIESLEQISFTPEDEKILEGNN
ncbi:hypothetical protein [Malaciobacter canalis]|uniref:hypothetical protein n=1 Tax=Malaciobacter canalis TaxID=1912871 RepID=UPI00384CB788